MTARFAGSRTLDERRRRWLAANEMEQAAKSAGTGSPKPRAAEEPVPAQARITQFPLRKVISPKGWKVASVAFLAFLLGAGILALGSGRVPVAPWLEPAWSRLYESQGVKLPRLFQAALLMASGQLAMLIWWGRSRSLRDFDGRYRVWLWSAALAMFAGWSLLGDWHWAFSDTICGLWSARFPMREVVCWMFPAGLVAGILWRKLRLDICDCRWSTCFFWLAAVSLAGACVIRLEIDRTAWPVEIKQLAGDSLEMLASVSLFVSFLAHTRFVLHISPEPPEVRRSLWAKLIAGVIVLLRKLPKPRFKLAFPWKRKAKKQQPKADKSTKTAVQSSEKTSAKEQPADKKEPAAAQTRKTDRGKQATQSAKSEVPKPAKPVASAPAMKVENQGKPAEPKLPPSTSAKNPEPAANEQKAEPAPAKSPAAEPKLRVDDPLDAEMLKGLSKKERRRLRKQHRESQRKNGGT